MSAETKTPVELWTEALRSGDYQQTQGRLRVVSRTAYAPVGFCCLGVACDLYSRHAGDGRWNEAHFVLGDDTDNGYVTLLPEEVRAWLGLRTDNGEWPIPGDEPKTKALTSTNDGGATFEEIAEIIESRPKGLFA